MGMSENRAQRAVLERLFALQDTKYRAFQSKLMPTVAPDIYRWDSMKLFTA